MKKKIRNVVASLVGFCLILLGFVRRAKNEISKNGKITGIYFHNPSKQLFEKCVGWLLKNGFTIISTQQLIDILTGNEKAVPKLVWISLDDGWRENMTNVLPYAAENEIPVTFFISTEPVESSGVFWWTLAEKFQNMLPEPYKNDINLLWKVPESERAKIINDLKQKTSGKFTREAMTVDDIKKISGYNFLAIGSHTVNHVIMPNCSENELVYELGESRNKLEKWSGKTINIFSYPNGDYSDREENFLKQNGYIMATVQDDEFITSDVNIYKVPRFSVGEGYFAEELCHMLGVWQKTMKKIKS